MTDLAVSLSPEREADAPAIQGLEERAFGPGRYARTAFRLRENNPHDRNLSFVARVGTLLVGSVRLTAIHIAQYPALMLGPLTVDPAFRSKGIGRMLIEDALDAATEQGHRLVLLVGDQAYYGRLGFRPVPPGQITMPGPVDPSRLLLRELQLDALRDIAGRVSL